MVTEAQGIKPLLHVNFGLAPWIGHVKSLSVVFSLMTLSYHGVNLSLLKKSTNIRTWTVNFGLT